MGVREVLKGRQSYALIAAVVMIVGAGIAIYVQARTMGGSPSGDLYYTIDDGQSFFTASSLNIPPFDYEGKSASRAHVFECGGKRVVGYLSRYTDEAMKALAEAKASQGTGRPPPNVRALASIGTTGIEVKRPGDAKWVRQADAAAATKVRVFRCPDGITPPEVFP